MLRRLAVTIVDRDPVTDRVVSFEAGTVPPAWAADRITNPDAWAPDAPTDSTGITGTDGAQAQVPPAAPGPTEPPRNGPGSGRDAWASHLAALGLDPDGLDRNAMIALLDELAPLVGLDDDTLDIIDELAELDDDERAELLGGA